MSILFLCDIDGTLVRGSYLNPKVIPSINSFIEEGNYFSLATGRNAFSIRWILKDLKVNVPCILLSGASLYDSFEDKLLLSKPIDNCVFSTLKEVYDCYKEVGIQVFTEKGLVNLRQNPFLRDSGIQEERECGVSSFKELQDQKILKLGLCCEDTNQLEKVVKQFFNNKELFHWHYSFRIAMEVLNPSASKGVAVQELISRLPEKPSLVVAAGDSPNDFSLFDVADMTFAPVTAFEEVKKRATHIIPSPEEGGVARIIEMLMQREVLE